MAQGNLENPVPPPGPTNFLRRLIFGCNNAMPVPLSDVKKQTEADEAADCDVAKKQGLIRRVSRKVVPGLPRMQTFKRQQSEKRINLAPVQPTPAERRAASEDRRAVFARAVSRTTTETLPRASAPDFLDRPVTPISPAQNSVRVPMDAQSVPDLELAPPEKIELEKAELEVTELDVAELEAHRVDEDESLRNPWAHDADSMVDTHSITTTQIQEELENRWILNLSMHFRDKSNREKFFVTYREGETLWRRVTISLDYRKAPENSLELDLMTTKGQRDKNAKIYEAIRDSLGAIRFYDTVTNLKLQTTDGRLHVHVAEDLNEIITYPTVREIQHLRCHRIRERDLVFDSHMSGFVYKVYVNGQVLIKKEIPGPDTINEFIYEINALYSLQYSSSVIGFFGVVVDDQDEHVKGLLISYAERGALVDVIYDHGPNNEKGLPLLPFPVRATWARQVVQGLADIHESGFVQGDFTLSNIVIDGAGNAKIIDINRRGCPVGWEPPEARPLLKSSQGISMYIGVKSDLYQLGMVLWALAAEDDEPEKYVPRLALGPEIDVPPWYRRLVEICLSDNPRMRLQASSLLSLFPSWTSDGAVWQQGAPSVSDYDDYQSEALSRGQCQTNGDPRIRTVSPTWSFNNFAAPLDAPLDADYVVYEPPYAYPARGRSPPSPLPSNFGQYDLDRGHSDGGWEYFGKKASYSDAGFEHDGAFDSAGITPRRELKPDGPSGAEDKARALNGQQSSVDDEKAIEGEGPLEPCLTGEANESAHVLQDEGVAAVTENEMDVNHICHDGGAADGEISAAPEPEVEDTAAPTENVGEADHGQMFENALGILAGTGTTEPNEQADSEQSVKRMSVVNSSSAEEATSSAGRTEPAGPEINTGLETAAAETQTAAGPAASIDDRSENGYEQDLVIAPAPEQPPCGEASKDGGVAGTSPSARTDADTVFSILAGVGGVDEGGVGDLTGFPTSLDEELGLLGLPAGKLTDGITSPATVDVKGG